MAEGPGTAQGAGGPGWTGTVGEPDAAGRSGASGAPDLLGDVGGGWSGTPRRSRPVTVFFAEAKRSSRESGAAVGPVSSVESSYNCPHQSSS
ncbi:hypothetical protein [Streptomyces sp. NPDC101237]|uniref:hypothetical protein n=1 Tax=Streptomyces sp. NPDC101237 TaxID=3366139 RepID=UPI0038210D96